MDCANLQGSVEQFEQLQRQYEVQVTRQQLQLLGLAGGINMMAEPQPQEGGKVVDEAGPSSTVWGVVLAPHHPPVAPSPGPHRMPHPASSRNASQGATLRVGPGSGCVRNSMDAHQIPRSPRNS